MRETFRSINLGLLGLGLLILGCVRGPSQPLDELKGNGQSNEYHIQKGDTLSVNVWGEQQISGDVIVREDGNITLKLVRDVKAVGLTLQQLSDSITTKLKRYIPGAAVSVAIAQTAPIRYFLSGLFVKPGEFRSDGRITMLQAIAAGGGFAPFADESEITLIRQVPGESGADLTEVRYTLDYNRVIEGREPNPELRNGDVLAVK